MADIQSPTAEIRRGKKKKEETTGQKYNGLPYSIGWPKSPPQGHLKFIPQIKKVNIIIKLSYNYHKFGHFSKIILSCLKNRVTHLSHATTCLTHTRVPIPALWLSSPTWSLVQLAAWIQWRMVSWTTSPELQKFNSKNTKRWAQKQEKQPTAEEVRLILAAVTVLTAFFQENLGQLVAKFYFSTCLQHSLWGGVA